MSDVFSNMKIFPNKSSHPVIKGNGTVTVSGVVEVKFTVMNGSNGIFASLPARKGNKPDENGKIPWYPDVKIPNEDLYHEFQNLVKSEWASVSGGNQGTSDAGEENQLTDNVPF